MSRTFPAPWFGLLALVLACVSWDTLAAAQKVLRAPST